MDEINKISQALTDNWQNKMQDLDLVTSRAFRACPYATVLR